MKILLISLFLPEISGTAAGSRLAGDILANLSSCHDVYLATRLEQCQTEKIKDIEPFCKKIYLFPYETIGERNTLALIKIILSYFNFSISINRITKAEHFDLIHVLWTESGLFLKKRDMPMLMVAEDVIAKRAERYFRVSRGLNSLLTYTTYILSIIMEKHIVKKFDKVLTRSECDRQYLLSMVPAANTAVIPTPAGLDFKDKEADRENDTILFLGSFKNHVSNVESVIYFYKKIYPLIRAEIPSVKFYVVGYGPTKAMYDTFGSDNSVIITGYVDDIESYYKKAMVFVAPMLTGGGIIVKVLDAMAAGTPVVSTTIGNEGIDGINNTDIVIADDPQNFADNVVSLLRDRDFWEKVSISSRRLAIEKFSPGATLNVLNRAYAEITEKKNV